MRTYPKCIKATATSIWGNSYNIGITFSIESENGKVNDIATGFVFKREVAIDLNLPEECNTNASGSKSIPIYCDEYLNICIIDCWLQNLQYTDEYPNPPYAYHCSEYINIPLIMLENILYEPPMNIIYVINETELKRTDIATNKSLNICEYYKWNPYTQTYEYYYSWYDCISNWLDNGYYISFFDDWYGLPVQNNCYPDKEPAPFFYWFATWIERYDINYNIIQYWDQNLESDLFYYFVLSNNPDCR